MPLQKPFAHFRRHQEKSASGHHRKFVFIHEEDVEGFYQSELEAYKAAIKSHPDGSFLLRPCLRPEEESAAALNSGVGGQLSPETDHQVFRCGCGT